MKLNKKTLKQIIKEELEAVLSESRILSKYTKDKEEELRQYIRDMGKDPDEVRDTLGPDSFKMMGQSLIDDYPRTMPLSRDSKIRLAYREVSALFGNLNDFYNPNSSGSSVFSKVLKLLPELRELRRVKKALQKVGGDSARVTAKIGGRKTLVVLRRKVKDLYDNLEDPWAGLEKHQDTRDYSRSPYEIGYDAGFLGLPPHDVDLSGDGSWADDDYEEYNRGYLDGLRHGGHK